MVDARPEFHGQQEYLDDFDGQRVIWYKEYGLGVDL